MSFLSPPKAPDPYSTAAAQAQFNTQAAQAQQKGNMIGQATPYGALSYSADPSQPGGYTATQTLSPAEQQLLSLQQQGQTGAGTAAAGLGGQLAGLYGQPAAIDPSSMTKQLMDWQTQYMQPYWDIQKSNLEAQLQNQGLTPGTEAWQNSMRAFTEGVGGQRNQFFAQAEPTAFAQALQQHELPMQDLSQLLGLGAPQGPSFVNTPQAQIQPPDYAGLTEQQYAQKNAQYGNLMQGLFSIPSAFAGGWGRSWGAK